MRAAVTTEAHGFDVVEVPDPVPGPGDVVVRVAACGVCGSDLKAQPFMPPGMVLGHEFGGEVVAVGSDADGTSLGVDVAVLPVISCGDCRYCRAGTVSHCASASFIGMGQAGGFAEYAAVPARHCFTIPRRLPVEWSAMVEPFAVGLHCVRNADIAPGDDVLIVGAGGVGLTTLMWALRSGGRRVTVVDPDPRRLALASTLGAADVLATVGEADGGAYDVVLECVGRPDLPRACQPALRPRGRLVIAGACAEPTAIEPVTALLRELTVRYSVAYTHDDFREVVKAFGSGGIDPTVTMGPTFDLSRIGAAFDTVRSGQAQGRVSVRPR